MQMWYAWSFIPWKVKFHERPISVTFYKRMWLGSLINDFLLVLLMSDNYSYKGQMIDVLLIVSRPLSLVHFDHPITLLRYADKHIVNIMKVYIERNNLKL